MNSTMVKQVTIMHVLLLYGLRDICHKFKIKYFFHNQLSQRFPANYKLDELLKI